jgi:hypothetical protein
MASSLSYITVIGLAALLSACGTEQVATAPVPVSAAPVIKDGSLMEPGRPQVVGVPDNAVKGAVQAVGWSMWWGENGKRWTMYVNGVEVGSGQLALDTPKEQQAKVELPLDKPGAYEIKVALCNDHGCSESEPVVMNVSAS